ncbi:radical SAM protein [Eubacterium aggregans]|uniref:radical SAM protein n=1 Tax=Eubacterium aggregans TaxID=81409 RepID=UPI003F2DA16C
MADKTVKETIKASAVNVALNYLDNDPEKNLPNLLDWVDRFNRGDIFLSFRKLFREVLDDPDNNWYQLMMSLWNDVDTDVRKTTFKNFIVNSALIGLPRGDAYREKYQCNIPWAILLDPTTACNLHCIGCWAAEYGKNTNMDYATISDIVSQGKKMGTYMYIFTGGEPLVRKKDIIRLCEEHSDCQFLSFTNGTLIDDAFAEEMLRVKNFVPAISVEGFGEATDSRWGEGTYDKVITAMENPASA